MSFNSMLEPTIQEILQVIKPLREDWEMRFRIIEELKNVVNNIESLRGATVEPFGSFVSNLFTRWGDLDISIKQFSGSSILFAGKKQKQSLLRVLLKALRQRGGWYGMQFIPQARVPILKTESGIQRISCDISIDNLEGLLKSKFLFWISEIDLRFRDMVLLVKEWAKAHDINNPKAGTFNSYTLSLLVIFHFQTCVPAILPPLREIYPRSAVEDLKGMRAAAEENIASISAANIARYKSDKSRAINRSSLSELFVSFLAKFSDINLKAKELGICPFTGRWESISTNMTWLPKTYSLFVEDPFEQPENAARSVSTRQLDRLSQVFEMSRHRLTSVNNNKDSLLAVLTKPRVSQFIPRTPIRTPGYNNGYMIHQTMHRPSPQGLSWAQNARPWHPRPQTPNQFQNGKPQHKYNVQNGGMRANSSSAGTQNQDRSFRPEGRVNGATNQRFALNNQSQGQHMWRPRSER